MDIVKMPDSQPKDTFNYLDMLVFAVIFGNKGKTIEELKDDARKLHGISEEQFFVSLQKLMDNGVVTDQSGVTVAV